MRNFAILSAASLFLASCASYNALPLNTLSSEEIDVKKPSQHPSITITAKKLSPAECMKYFDRDVIKKGYLPIQLYIQNDTNSSYAFSLNRISLATARPEEVAEKVHTSTVGRAVGYGTGALFFWPLAIPAVVDGVKSSQANESLDADFEAKAARDQIISMHSYFNRVLFVPVNEYTNSFTLTLIDVQTHASKTITVSVNGS